MTQIDNQWSESTLWGKAVQYAQLARDSDRDSWLYPFWSSLTLEFVARAALASKGTVLLADTADTNNVLYALGLAPYSPSLKSVGIAEVLNRCEKLFPDFTGEHRKFCGGFTSLRNEELHSGSTPFAELRPAAWLPRYYDATRALLSSCGRTLEDLVGGEESAAATMIAALHDDAAKQVKKLIAAHRTIWQNLKEEERDARAQHAAATAQRKVGHVTVCPACGSNGLTHGEVIKEQDPELVENEVVERSVMLPIGFECLACDLEIEGHSQMHACDLGDQYTKTRWFDAVDYYEPQYEPEPDFNE